MHTENIDFASMITSRICHDLISPIGAISNGLELLQLTGANEAGEEFSLVTNSIENAKARIMYFRMAFGVATDGTFVSSRDAQLIVAGYFNELRSEVVWEIQEDQTRKTTKLVLLLLLCVNSALPRGGNITVRPEDNALIISASTDRLHLSDALWSHLRSLKVFEEIGPADIHFELARNQLICNDQKLAVDAQKNLLTLTITD